VITISLEKILMSIRPALVGMPANFDALVYIVTHHSAVTTGGIVRFTLIRLCYSYILSIQDIFQTSFNEIKVWRPALFPD